MSKFAVLGFVASLATSVSAHGYVAGIVVNGQYSSGYSPSFQYQNPPPAVAGWSTPQDQDNGFIDGTGYADPNIICHKGATPGQASVAANGGDKVTLEWTQPWPPSHHGPVLTYLADCKGPCESVDKTSLQFVKIDEAGLTTPGNPGNWATDDLIANNGSWAFTMPQVAAGNYVVRHEIIALHSAGQVNGAQNYPFCINFKIAGSGPALPAGTVGTSLYKTSDPGITVNIYQDNTAYTIPGPKLWSGAGGADTGSGAGSGSGSASSSAAPSATSAASSAADGSSSATRTSAAATSTGGYTGGSGSSTGSAATPTVSKTACKKRRQAFKA